MKIRQALTTRRRRLVVLGSIAAGWMLVAVGAASEVSVMITVGAVVTGLTAIALAKAVLEGDALLTAESAATSGALRRVERRLISRIDGAEQDIRDRIDGAEQDIRDRIDGVIRDLESVNDGLARCNERIELHQSSLSRLDGAYGAARETIKGLKSSVAGLRGSVDAVKVDVRGVKVEHNSTRSGLVDTRRLIDKLAARVPTNLTDDRLLRAGHADADEPLLSIAIPSFNRPEALAECLSSIETSLASCPSGVVEVCITDDVSTDPDTLDVAVSFAERNSYVSVRRNPSNIGLARNLLAACEPCRGEYLLILGNDDRLRAGGLQVIIDDVRSDEACVYVYEKARITREGKPREDAPGSTPIELPSGEAHLFASFVDASSRQGLVSTFGFVSTIVFPRRPFVEIDPSPYQDLTMYPQVFMMIEAFGKRPVQFRNVRTVDHRTPTSWERSSEVLGRPEEAFWTPGSGRRARYFGTTMAASLQRVIDGGHLSYPDVATLPESLLTDQLLVEWVEANRSIDDELDAQLDAAVVSDANRFFAGLRAASANDLLAAEVERG